MNLVDSIISELNVNAKHFCQAFGANNLQIIENKLRSMNLPPNSSLFDPFWSCLSSLPKGILSFTDQIQIFDFFCQAGDDNSYTLSRIYMLEQFFLQYHNLTLEQFITNNLCFEYDMQLIALFISIFQKLSEDQISNELGQFLIQVAQKSSAKFSDIVSFYINTIFQYLSKSSSYFLLQFLVDFIDGIEGRIDSSKYNHKLFKKSKKARNLRIMIHNESIDLLIHPMKTSFYSIRSTLSALKNVPFDSFYFDVEILSEKVKTINLIESGNFNMEPSSFESFPSTLISQNSNFIQHLFMLNKSPEYSRISIKLLHRLMIPEFPKKPDYFSNILIDTNIFPGSFQYWSELIFFHYLQCDNIEQKFEYQHDFDRRRFPNFKIIVQIFNQSLICNRFPLPFLKTTIEILRLFVNEIDIDNDQIFNLLSQFLIYPKCSNLLYLVAQFIKDHPSKKIDIVIQNQEFLRKLVLLTNLNNFKAMKIILSKLNGYESFSFLIQDILGNYDNYLNIAQYVQKIARIAFDKYPNIVDFVISIPTDVIATKASQITCDVLNEAYRHKEYEVIELLSGFFQISIQNNDLLFKKSINRFLKEIKGTEEIRLKVLLSIVFQEFNIVTNSIEKPARCYNGLSNSGNTCYINSILQQLNSIDDFYEALITDPYEKGISTDLQNMKILFSKMRYQADVGSIDTNEYCELFQQNHSYFEVFRQQDADEFLHELFQVMPKNLIKIFEGKMTNVIIDASNYSSKSSTSEIFTTISINVKNHSDLESSFRDYLRDDLIFEGNDKSTVVAYRRIVVNKLPKILIFHLKRFDYSFDYQTRMKINSFFSFPTAINMDDYIYDNNAGKDAVYGIYYLRGVVIHSGESFGGHYTSIIKSDSGWLLCNDSSVRKIDENYMINMSYGDIEKTNENAYLLFYEKDQNTFNF